MSYLAEQTPYQVLEISAEASLEQIDAAYQHMTTMVSDDSLALYAMMGEDEATQLRALVEEAYALLSDPRRRQAYDFNQRQTSGLGPRDGAPAAARLHALGRLDEGERQEASAPGALEKSLSPSLPPKPPVGSSGAKGRRAPFVVRPTEPLDQAQQYSGEVLRALRLSAGATLEDVSDMTKVGLRYLTAIENNDFSALPARVYIRGFLKEYARTLGLDAGAVSASYFSLMEAGKRPR